MALPKFETDISYISRLSDEPNDVGTDGLSAAELKERFDMAGNMLKDFLNTELIPYLEAVTGAGDIGIEDIPGLNDAANVQAALEELKAQLNNTSTGSIPDRSLGGIKLQAAAVGTAELEDESVTAEKLADGVIDDDKIAAVKLSGAALRDKAIDNRHLNGKLVKGTNIADNSIGAGQIADLAIPAGKLAENAVQTAKIQDSAVTREKLEANAVSNTYTAAIGTVWEGEAGPFTQEIAIAGLLAEDTPVVDIEPSADYAEAEAQLEAWAAVYRIVPGADKITVYAADKTTTAIPIKLLCIRR